MDQYGNFKISAVDWVGGMWQAQTRPSLYCSGKISGKTYVRVHKVVQSSIYSLVFPVFRWYFRYFGGLSGKSRHSKFAVPLEVNSRKDNKLTGCKSSLVTKHYYWFALVSKYLRGKIKQTSLTLTEIWPISDRFIKQKYNCITVHYHTVCGSENRLGQTVQNGQQTLTSGTIFGLCRGSRPN